MLRTQAQRRNQDNQEGQRMKAGLSGVLQQAATENVRQIQNGNRLIVLFETGNRQRSPIARLLR